MNVAKLLIPSYPFPISLNASIAQMLTSKELLPEAGISEFHVAVLEE